MFSRISRATLFYMFLITAAPIFADTDTQLFIYRLNGYPKTSQSCHVEAKNLADRFSQMTSTSATGECKAINELTYDISIVYSATQQLTPVTTYPDSILSDRLHIFQTEIACKDRLTTELDYFKKTTGLEPLIALCAIDETYFGLKTWALRIDAFGVARVKPYWAQSYMLGNVDGMSEAGAEEMVADAFSKAGVDVRLVNLRNDPQGTRRLAMLYYAEKPLEVEIKVLASELDNREQCEAELQEIIRIAPANGPQALYCSDNKHELSFEVLGVVEVHSWFRQKASVESFKDYSACAAGRDELIDIYRNTAGRDVAGGLCSKIDDVWRLNLMERAQDPE